MLGRCTCPGLWVGLGAERKTRLYDLGQQVGLAAPHILLGRNRKGAGFELPGLQHRKLLVAR
jgi:hypothetical protein